MSTREKTHVEYPHTPPTHRVLFAPKTTVLTIPASDVNKSLTGMNKRTCWFEACGDAVQEDTKIHDRGRIHNPPLPAGWKRHVTDDGNVYYCPEGTLLSTWAHPVAVSGATWSNAHREESRKDAAAKRHAKARAEHAMAEHARARAEQSTAVGGAAHETALAQSFEPSGPFNATAAALSTAVAALNEWSQSDNSLVPFTGLAITVLAENFVASEIGSDLISSIVKNVSDVGKGALATVRTQVQKIAENYFIKIDDGDGIITAEELRKKAYETEADSTDGTSRHARVAANELEIWRADVLIDAAKDAGAKDAAIRALQIELEADMSNRFKSWLTPYNVSDTADQAAFYKIRAASLKKGMTVMFESLSAMDPTFRISMAVKCVVETMLQDRKFIDALGNEKDLAKLLDEAIPRTLSRTGLTPDEIYSVRRAVEIRVKDPESMLVAKRFFTAGVAVNKKQFKDAIRLTTEETMSDKNLTYTMATQQATVWLSTQTDKIVEEMHLQGKMGQKVADLIGVSAAVQPTRVLLQDWLKKIDPECDVAILSKLRIDVADSEKGTLEEMIRGASALSGLYNDKTLAILKEARLQAMNVKAEQLDAWLESNYNSVWKLAASLGLAAASLVFGCFFGCFISLIGLYRYRCFVTSIFCGSTSISIRQCDLRPCVDKQFYSWTKNGKQFWAQYEGRKLRQCKNKGAMWAGTQLNKKYVEEKDIKKYNKDTPKWLKRMK